MTRKVMTTLDTPYCTDCAATKPAQEARERVLAETEEV